MDLREELTRVVGPTKPLDVDELVVWSKQVAVLDPPRVYGGVDQLAVENWLRAASAESSTAAAS